MKTRKSSVYKKWIKNLRDDRARYRINAWIERLKQGNPGDVKPVGEGISEMRIDYGPGYRVYYIGRVLQGYRERNHYPALRGRQVHPAVEYSNG